MQSKQPRDTEPRKILKPIRVQFIQTHKANKHNSSLSSHNKLKTLSISLTQPHVHRIHAHARLIFGASQKDPQTTTHPSHQPSRRRDHASHIHIHIHKAPRNGIKNPACPLRQEARPLLQHCRSTRPVRLQNPPSRRNPQAPIALSYLQISSAENPQYIFKAD